MNIVGAPSASEVDVNVEPDVYKCSWYNRIIKRPVDWGEFTWSVWGDQSLPRYRSQGTLHRCLFLAFLHDIQVATTFQFLFDWTENETQLDHVFIFLSICDWFNSMFDFLRLIHFKLSFFFTALVFIYFNQKQIFTSFFHIIALLKQYIFVFS